MRKICGFVVLLVVCLGLSSVAWAEENHRAAYYMAEGIREAYDNMHLVYQAYYDDEGNLEEQPGGFVAIWQEWNGDRLIAKTYLDENCESANGTEGYAKAEWKTDEAGIWYVEFYDSEGKIVPTEGINLAREIEVGSDGWSNWMAPKNDVANSTFTLGSVILGRKQIGDIYTCSFEIEFRNVTATKGTEEQQFVFRTQGAIDGEWIGGNIWNSSLILLNEPIENGTKTCVASVTLSEAGANTSRFDLGFRCDYWASGEFRIRNVRVERGTADT